MIIKFIIFLIVNFIALAIGGLFTGKGVPSDWYQNINKAPWTPPGWVFGAAWTLIMICFSVYMAQLWSKTENLTILLFTFAVQWILNVSWNPVFFYFHHTLAGLFIISALTLLIGYMAIKYLNILQWNTIWIAPYFIWLLIATSLNAYIYFKN